MNILNVSAFLIFTLFYQSYASIDKESYASDEAVGNANDYVDEVLQNFRKEPWILNKVEPLTIPDVKEKNFEISDGKVTGLSTLYRHGDCSLDYEDDVIRVTAQVAVRDIVIDVKYRAKALFFWIKGHATLTVEDLAVKMVIAMKDGKAQVETFKVIHLGKYKLKKITGLSVVLNWLLKLIANAVAKNSRQKIINALESGVAKAVNEQLAKFKLPDVSQYETLSSYFHTLTLMVKYATSKYTARIEMIV